MINFMLDGLAYSSQVCFLFVFVCFLSNTSLNLSLTSSICLENPDYTSGV